MNSNLHTKGLGMTLIFCIALQVNVFSQFSVPDETYLPPSPAAASFAEYAEVPNGHYTGIPQIAIPIQNFTSNEVGHNVSLSYHSGGIKVAEKASNVGLGWNLNIGGVISRSVRGAPDEHLFEGQVTGYLEDGVDTSWYSTHESQVASGERDMQSDVYFFNFNGYSGSFLIQPDGGILQEEASDLIIEYEFTNYAYNKLIWKIYTPDGTVYYFGDDSPNDGIIDDAVSYSNSYIDATFNTPASFRNHPLVDAWHLVKIESFTGASSIDFEYDEFEEYHTRQIASPLEGILEEGRNVWYPGIADMYNEGAFFINVNKVTFTDYLTPRLTKIITNNRHVHFTYADTTRKDLSIWKQVAQQIGTTINIPTSKIHNPAALESIQIASLSDVCLLEYDFSTSYFYSSDHGFYDNFGEIDEDGTDSFGEYYSDQRRLRLDSLTERSCNSSITKTTSFSYSTDTIARGLSFNRDHQGYPNGGNNETLVPKLVIYDGLSDPAVVDLTSIDYLADRECNPNHPIEAQLEKITYPTGGEVSFEFERHDYYGVDVTETPNYLINMQNCSTPFGDPACNGNTFETPDVPLNANATVHYELIIQATKSVLDQSNTEIYVDVEFSFNGGAWQMIDNVVLSTTNGFSVLKCYSQDNFNSGANGDYKFRLQPSDASRLLFLSIQLIEFTRTITNTNLPIGGYRIHRITEDPISSPQKIRQFNYVNGRGSTQSSGKVIGLPTYVEVFPDSAAYIDQFSGACYEITDPAKLLNGNTFTLNSIQGSHIGYLRVEEEIIGANNGYEVYSFLDDVTYEASMIHDFPVYPEYYIKEEAGYPSSVRYFDNSNQEVSSTIYHYQVHTHPEVSTSYSSRSYLSCESPPALNDLHTINIEWNTHSRFVYKVQQFESLDGVQIERNFEYDSLDIHHQLTAQTSRNSDGKEHREEFYYLIDYPNLVKRAQFLDEHRLLPSWRQIKKVDNLTTDIRDILFQYYDTNGNSTTSATNTLLAYKNRRREFTWLNNAYFDQGWQDEYTNLSQDPNVWKPTEVSKEGWVVHFDFEWSPSAKLITKNFDPYDAGLYEHKTQYTYHPESDLLATTTEIDGQVIEYEYDDLLRLEYIKQRNNNLSTQFSYNYIPNTIKAINAFTGLPDRTTIQEFDGLGKLIKTTKKQYNEQEQDVISEITYNNRGLIDTRSDFDGNFTSVQYHPDPLDRIHTETDPMGFVTSYEFGSNSNEVNGYMPDSLYLQKVIDPDNLETITFLDKRGRTIMERRTDGASNNADTYYQYDDKDRIETIIPPDASLSDMNLIYSYTYDGNDNMLSKKMPDQGLINYAYDVRDFQIGMQNQKMVAEGKDWLVTNIDVYGRPFEIGFGSLNSLIYNPLNELLIRNWYDGIGSGNSSNLIFRGKKDVSQVNILEGYGMGSQNMITLDSFDLYGRTAKTMITNPVGGDYSYDYGYDMSDNIVVKNQFTAFDTTYTENYYDHQGRLDSTKLTIGGESQFVLSGVEYSNNDLITTKHLRDAQENILFSYNQNNWLTNMHMGGVSFEYESECDNGTSPSDFFDLSLFYHDQTGASIPSPTRKNGNISALNWQQAGHGVHGDNFGLGFTYDFLDRITQSISTQNDEFGSSYTYADKRGNLSHLVRHGYIKQDSCFSSERIDSLSYSYYPGTNRLRQVHDSEDGDDCPDYEHLPETLQSGQYGVQILISSDGMVESDENVTYKSEQEILLEGGFEFTPTNGGTFLATIDTCPDNNHLLNLGLLQHGFIESSTADYAYDDNGNLSHHADKDIHLAYNYLNLPYQATKGTDSILWVYTAEGEKLRKRVVFDTNTYSDTYYYNEIELADSSLVAYHSEGQVRKSNDTLHWEYNIKDHLGNVRLVYEDSDLDGIVEVLQNNHYYPFGMRMYGEWSNSFSDNDYLYNGKELSHELGLGYYEYGARCYDPVLGRFSSVDPLASKFPGTSPYVYTNNNPIALIDIGGLFPWPVTVRSFISADKVGLGRFRGDGRGASFSGTSRVYSSFTVNPSAGTLTNRSTDSDPTVFYGTPPFALPPIPRLEEDPNPEMSAFITGSSENTLSMSFSHEAKDPITPGFATPDLDLNASLSFSEDLDNGILSVSGSFTGDNFPSAEAFITDQSGTNLFLGASMETGGVHSLFGENNNSKFNVNMQILFDSNGKFTGVKLGETTYSVQDWNQQVQDSFNK